VSVRVPAAALAVAALAWCAPAGAAETLQARLLRTTQIGVPQDVEPDEIERVARDPNGDYVSTMLARSALVVLRRDDPGLVPFDELFDGVLGRLVASGNSFPSPPGLPDFRGKELVFTMLYAMVMSGGEERAVDVLARHLLIGSKYAQGIVLSALRNVGTPRAKGLIQQYADKGQDPNLAETTLADEDFPVLIELYQRRDVVPPASRVRERLLEMVRGGCDDRATMAVYWLGFFAPNADAQAEAAEVDALRAMTDARGCGWMEHIVALKAFGLRAAETDERWAARVRATENVWERHQVVIDAFARLGRAFAPAALDLLATEPVQYVQWELMNGNLETRRRRPYRTYWDVWIPVNILAAIQNESGDSGEMPEADVGELLGWLEAGHHPQDAAVTNHMLYNLAGFVRGDATRRFLRLFAARANRERDWWILAGLGDPAALPLLRYWSAAPAPDDQAETLKAVIDRLASREGPRPARPSACCRPTEQCLVERTTAAPDPVIRSEDDAARWLVGESATGPAPGVRFVDTLARDAWVRPDGGAEEHWQYLYDCWRRVAKNEASPR
jgi:hypothetical protein